VVWCTKEGVWWECYIIIFIHTEHDVYDCGRVKEVIIIPTVYENIYFFNIVISTVALRDLLICDVAISREDYPAKG
jgi:hypothetical protein